MDMVMLPSHLIKLIESLKKLPGVGSKSAERFAFHLINWSPSELAAFAQTIEEIPEKLQHCAMCGCLRGDEDCLFCQPYRQNSHVLCVVASARDALSVESTREYQGLYHVLGGLLSPLEGITPDKLRFAQLKERIATLNIKEIVIALDATVEGDATSLYLKQELTPLNLILSRLAFGLPMGSSFDYVDEGTLARAFSGRGTF
ncbi:Recombination protein RecR [Chlamydiales bacterium STE3]|nr:Recombination protein RecR [Chlamydiales bacterium STE3]